MSKRFVFAVYVLLISGFCFVSCLKIEKTPDVILAALNSMERLSPYDPVRGGPEAVVKAARNEFESFQVVISPVQRNIRVVKAEMSELKSDKGIIGQENIKLFREEYVRVRRSSPEAQLPPGLFPDPLLPFINQVTGKPIEVFRQYRKRWGEPVISSGSQLYPIPFEIWQGQNQPLWIDIYIPKDAAAGEYRGVFTITLDPRAFSSRQGGDTLKSNTFSLPVKLTVWDFTLPDGPGLRNHFGNFRGVARAFDVEPDSEKFREIEMNYCRMMAEHRINPPLLSALMPEMNPDGSLKISASRHEALKKYIEEFNITDFEIPRAPLRDVTTTNREKAIRYYRDYYNYVKDNGWDKQAYLYMWDEPNLKENYEQVIAVGEIVQTAAPQLKRLVVEQTYLQDPDWPDMDPAIDIWCPLFSFIDRESVNSKIASGDEVWSYTALVQTARPYHPNYEKVKNLNPPYWQIDMYLSSYRTPGWMNYQYNIKGLLYWSSVYNNRSVSGVVDPWFLPYFSDFGKTCNGEGFLMYPGHPCGIDGPVSSIRFKTIRDSMEDYEYFTILEKLAGREAVLKYVSMVAPDWWDTATDPNIIFQTREMIAKEIVRLKNN